MKDTPTLQSERLLLRPLLPEDLDDVYEWTSSFTVTRYLWWHPNRDRSVTEKLLNKWIRQKRNYSWAVVKEKEVIGEVQVIKDLPNKGFEFGMISKESSWGHGYMKEALVRAFEYCCEDAGYEYGYAESDARNERSYHVLSVLGFKLVETKKDVLIEKKGETIDVYCFRLTKEDFRKALGQFKEAKRPYLS